MFDIWRRITWRSFFFSELGQVDADIARMERCAVKPLQVDGAMCDRKRRGKNCRAVEEVFKTGLGCFVFYYNVESGLRVSREMSLVRFDKFIRRLILRRKAV